MLFTKNTILVLLCAVATNYPFADSTPTDTTKNETEGGIQFSGWKPMVKEEALTPTEFVEKLEEVAKVAKVARTKNNTDLDAADTKRSFLLVYPPRPQATEEKLQKQEVSPDSARSQGPPIRSYPTQSRYHRMMNFGVPQGANGHNRRAPTVYQRPKFPPVANPPPLPEHALKNRQRIPPNFTPESTSRHQVQIQLLDGYIVPPSGGGVSNNHAEKKTPQLATFPLNLNNVPEIRLLLPGDVHQQLNNLRQPNQNQQNRHSGPQHSDGRNAYSFESQRRPGRTVEYSHTNGRPQQPNFNQNQDYSSRDPAIYPETVNFPGQNNQNSINNGASYNQAKPQIGDVSSNDVHSNQGHFPDNSRATGPHTKTHDETGGQNFPQNYGGDGTSLSDTRGYVSPTSRGQNEQSFPQNYAGQQIPSSDNRGQGPHSKTHDATNGQSFPQNYAGQQIPSSNNRGQGPHSKTHDATNGQSFPQNYAGQQFPSSDNRGQDPHSKTHDATNGQTFPQNYAGQQFPSSDNRGQDPHSKTDGATNGQAFPQNYGNQNNQIGDNRTPITQTKIDDVPNYSNFGGQQSPSLPSGTPVVHTSAQDTANVHHNLSPNFRGHQSHQPSFDDEGPVHSRPHGTAQSIPHDVVQQKYEPGDIQTGQRSIDPFQGGSFRPLSTDSRNYNTQNDRNANNYPTGSGIKTNGNNNDGRGYQNGWRASPGIPGIQSYSPVGVPPGNTNFYSGAPGNQNTKSTNGQRSSQPGSNFYFGTGTDDQNSNKPSHTPSTSDHDHRNTPNHHQKTHVTAHSPSSSSDHDGRPSRHTSLDSATHGPSGSGHDSRSTPHTHKTHVAAHSPSSTGHHSSRTSPHHQTPHTSTHGTSSSGHDSRSRPHTQKTHVGAHSPSSTGHHSSRTLPHQQTSHSPHGTSSTGHHDSRTLPHQQTSHSPHGTSNSGHDSRSRPNTQKTHVGAHSPSSTGHHSSRTSPHHQPSHISPHGTSSSGHDSRSRPNTQKTHVGAHSPSSTGHHSSRTSPHHQTPHTSPHGTSSTGHHSSRTSPHHQTPHTSPHGTSSSGHHSSRTSPHHQSPHGTSGSGHDSRGIPAPGVDKSVPTDIFRDGGSQSDLGPKSSGPGDDIYFVPPVLTQQEEQTELDDFDSPASRDTTINKGSDTPTDTGKGEGVLIDHGAIPDFATVDGVPKSITSEMTFARQEFCECSQSCAPIQRSPNEDLGSSIREIARSLNADAFFDFVGLTDEEIENTLASDGSYTFFIPSNEAVSRLPSNLVDHWRENNPDLKMALLNHVVRDRVTLDQLRLGGRMTSRANDATVFINNYNNEAVTVNGHRIVHGDISAPKGGTIHVIDGTLCPVADQDIINTLRTCNKYDGFLTLADVTKLLETMQDDGPYTVFLPSNEALTKIPADELAVLKENSTVLREFLEYHIVQGAYFSGDLKDGQYLTTLHQRQPVRMGVRVDGCYRRLVETNNSPIFKSDIPTKNGVIHVVDWILRPSDLQWCDGVVLP